MAGARGQWNSRFGFIMAAVGSAVGLGNLVRFPRELAGNGGAAFLIVYLGLLFLVGLPAILGEMTMGKMANASPVNAFRKLGGKHGKKWAAVGVAGMLAAMFVLFFYTVISGWALRFFAETFRDGWFDDPTGLFASVETGPWTMFWHFVVTTVTIAIVAKGVSGGIEKVAVIIMPTLFAIVIGIVGFAIIKDASTGFAGLEAIFKPDFSQLNANNVSRAVGQVFFSLSLGQGAMMTYASYMEKKQSVYEDGHYIAFADTGVALLGAMMVFPVLSFTGLLMSQDPAIQSAIGGTFGTAFIALPSAFVEMGAVVGRIVGALFFLGLFFAALSSAISLLEVPTSVLVDNLKLTRPKAALLVGLITYTFGIMASTDALWLEFYDEIAVNFFIVIGVGLTTLFAGWLVAKAREELHRGLDSTFTEKVSHVYLFFMRYVTPALIFVVFIVGGLFGADPDGNLVFWASGEEQGWTYAGWRKLGHTASLLFS